MYLEIVTTLLTLFGMKLYLYDLILAMGKKYAKQMSMIQKNYRSHVTYVKSQFLPKVVIKENGFQEVYPKTPLYPKSIPVSINLVIYIDIFRV